MSVGYAFGRVFGRFSRVDDKWEGDGPNVRCGREVIRLRGLISFENVSGVDREQGVLNFEVSNYIVVRSNHGYSAI